MFAIFLDLETNGLNPSCHRILEIAFSLRDLSDKGKEEARYQAIIRHPEDVWRLSDPTSLKVNGFRLEDLRNGIEESAVAEEVKKFFENYGLEREMAVFICQNPAFDRAFFTQLVDLSTQEKRRYPYHWLDLASMYFAKVVRHHQTSHIPFPARFSLSKDNIALAYQLEREQQPHRAMNGVDHLIRCFEQVIGWP